MKKIPIFLIILCFAFNAVAQQSPDYPLKVGLFKDQEILYPPLKNPTVFQNEGASHKSAVVTDNESATFVKIGEAARLFNYLPQALTNLWADPRINSVVFTHHLTNGWELGYDISTDGGSTWASNIGVYPADSNDPISENPQGGIINFPGNTNPDDAFYTYQTPIYYHDTVPFGGEGFGVNILTDTITPGPTRNIIIQDSSGYIRVVENAFTITQQGVSWYVGGLYASIEGELQYSGNIVLGRGVMNEAGTDIVYAEQVLPFLDIGDVWTDSKIAFAPDGQTGYICYMSSSDSDPQPFTIFHPVLIKTTDGGGTWSEPIHVQFGGDAGIPFLKNYFSNEAIEAAGYETGFNRNEVYYNMGWSFDLITDYDGNPYLTGIIAVADHENWYPYETQMATWNLYSKDGGETWNADALYDNIWFAGTIGNYLQDNHPYLSSSFDGDCLFFSWLDSDIDAAEGNNRPNIYIVGYNVEEHAYSEIINVTYFTQAWNLAFFGSQSHWIFTNVWDDYVECEIPFIFYEFTDPEDELAPINIWYIDGYDPFWFGCACNTTIGIEDHTNSGIKISVGQNYPNPATDRTQILVSVETELPIVLAVSNIAGQVVYTTVKNSKAKSHAFEVDVSDLVPGIYFYSVQVGDQTVTKKMVVG